MKSLSSILIYFGLQAVAGALLPANIFLALLLSTLLSIALFFAFGYISVKDFGLPQKVWQTALLAVVFLLPSLAVQEGLDIDASNLEALFSQIFQYPVVAAMSIGVIGPIAEEVLFRGIIQSQLTNLFNSKEQLPKNPWYPVVLTALLFALFHLELAQMPHAFIVGLLLSWLRSKYSLTASTLFHIVNNSSVFALTFILGDDFKLTGLFGGNILLLSLCLLLSNAISGWLIFTIFREKSNVVPQKYKDKQ